MIVCIAPLDISVTQRPLRTILGTRAPLASIVWSIHWNLFLVPEVPISVTWVLALRRIVIYALLGNFALRAVRITLCVRPASTVLLDPPMRPPVHQASTAQPIPASRLSVQTPTIVLWVPSIRLSAISGHTAPQELIFPSPVHLDSEQRRFQTIPCPFWQIFLQLAKVVLLGGTVLMLSA